MGKDIGGASKSHKIKLICRKHKEIRRCQIAQKRFNFSLLKCHILGLGIKIQNHDQKVMLAITSHIISLGSGLIN